MAASSREERVRKSSRPPTGAIDGQAVIRLAAGALALTLAGGCTSTPVGSAPATRADDAPLVRDSRYTAALDRATRTGTIYEGLTQRAFGAVTRQTGAFRRERVLAESRFLHLSEAETTARLEFERLDAVRHLDFFVGLYTADRRWNDLERPNSIWRVELDTGHATFLPLSVQRIDRPDANLTALYPYLTRFWVAYRIRFPSLDTAGAPLFPPDAPVLLRLSSAAGKFELRWDRDGEGPAIR